MPCHFKLGRLAETYNTFKKVKITILNDNYLLKILVVPLKIIR